MDVSKSYFSFIEELKNEINSARIKASISVNKELILLYWNIGLKIIQKKENEHWGAKIIEKISQSLKHEFPEMKGFSPRNLTYMQTFAKEFPEFEFFSSSLPSSFSSFMPSFPFSSLGIARISSDSIHFLIKASA